MCGMFETNPKLENKPETWKQRIVRDKIHLLQKTGKSYYTGDKINLLQKVGKSKINKFRVKLYTKIILRIRLMTGVKKTHLIKDNLDWKPPFLYCCIILIFNLLGQMRYRGIVIIRTF